MGGTVVPKPAEWTPLTALLPAEAVRAPGVPDVVTGDGRAGAALVAARGDKAASTGSTEVARTIRAAAAQTGEAPPPKLGGKSPRGVFEDAGLGSAVEGRVDAIQLDGGQVRRAGSHLQVQKGMAEHLHVRIRRRSDRLHLGDPLDEVIDVGAIAGPRQLGCARAFLEDAPGEVDHAGMVVPEGCFFPPTLVTGLEPTDRLVRKEVFGPSRPPPPSARPPKRWCSATTPDAARPPRSGPRTSISRSR